MGLTLTSGLVSWLRTGLPWRSDVYLIWSPARWGQGMPAVGGLSPLVPGPVWGPADQAHAGPVLNPLGVQGAPVLFHCGSPGAGREDGSPGGRTVLVLGNCAGHGLSGFVWPPVLAEGFRPDACSVPTGRTQPHSGVPGLAPR